VFVEHKLIERIIDALDLGGEIMTTFPRGAAGPGNERHGGPTYVKCPHCAVVMNRRLFATGAKVVIDVCGEHGFWFDAAELRAVAEFAAGGGMERAARRDAAERAQHRAQRATRPSTIPAVTTEDSRDEPSLLDDILQFLSRW
jgi:Zn-finger nucleic acid-binding protein